MPLTISDDDALVLKRFLEKKLSYDRAHPTKAYPKFELDAFKRVLGNINRLGLKPKVWPEPGLDTSDPDRRQNLEPAKPRAKDPTLEAGALVLCGSHPNYTARRTPRTQCKGCWAAYERKKKRA